MPAKHFTTEAARFQKIGQDLYRQKDFETSLLYFTKALKHQNVGSLEVYDNRAATYSKLGKLDHALRDGKAMIQADKTNPIGYLRTGKTLSLQGKEEAAHGIYEYGLSKVPVQHRQYQLLKDTYQKLVSRRSPTKASDPLLRFPLEVRTIILAGLPFRDIIRLFRVSKQWKYLISQDAALWKNLDFSSASRAIRRTAVTQYLRNGQRRTKVLKASLKHLTYEKPIWNIAKQSGVLEEVEILDGPLVGQSLLDATAYFGNLKSLITRADITCDTISQVLYRCSNLERAEFHRVLCFREATNDRVPILFSGEPYKLKQLFYETLPPERGRQMQMSDEELVSFIRYFFYLKVMLRVTSKVSSVIFLR